MSEILNLTPDVVDGYQEILMHPQDHGFDFAPLDQVMIPADEYFDNSALFKLYVAYIGVPLPKIIFYIIMNRMYGPGPTPQHTIGYKVKFQKPVTNES